MHRDERPIENEMNITFRKEGKAEQILTCNKVVKISTVYMQQQL